MPNLLGEAKRSDLYPI